MALGVSFQPLTNDQADKQASSAALAPNSSVIQTLATHLPSILGARPVAPGALLTPHPTGLATPESAVMQTLLKVFGPQSAPAGAPQGATGGGVNMEALIRILSQVLSGQGQGAGVPGTPTVPGAGQGGPGPSPTAPVITPGANSTPTQPTAPVAQPVPPTSASDLPPRPQGPIGGFNRQA